MRMEVTGCGYGVFKDTYGGTYIWDFDDDGISSVLIDECGGLINVDNAEIDDDGNIIAFLVK